MFRRFRQVTLMIPLDLWRRMEVCQIDTADALVDILEQVVTNHETRLAKTAQDATLRDRMVLTPDELNAMKKTGGEG